MKWMVAIAGGLLITDEIIKWMALRNAWAIHKNFGIAFDIPLPGWLMIGLTSLIILAATGALWCHRTELKLAVCLVFIIAGGIGNLFDRLIYGFVVDYLIINTSAFNICDLMILGGVVGLLFSKADKQKINQEISES